MAEGCEDCMGLALKSLLTAVGCKSLDARQSSPTGFFPYASPIHTLSDMLKDGKEVKWPDSMYPDLHMPYAPSWSLHWAYRDGHLVNLPVSLLVEGDIIALRPGQESFASLRGIKVT